MSASPDPIAEALQGRAAHQRLYAYLKAAPVPPTLSDRRARAHYASLVFDLRFTSTMLTTEEVAGYLNALQRAHDAVVEDWKRDAVAALLTMAELGLATIGAAMRAETAQGEVAR